MKNNPNDIQVFILECYADHSGSKTIQNHKEEKILGAILLTWDGRVGEFAWCHTAPNFVVFHAGSGINGVKVRRSTPFIVI